MQAAGKAVLPDDSILGLFYARNEDAIEAVDNKYGPSCRGVSYNILCDYQDAEECVNDAYLGAWNSIPPNKPNPLRVYLLRIVRNISISRLRANTAQKRNSIYAVAMSEIESELTQQNYVENEFQARNLADSIEKFLDGLSQEDRVIFMRRYWFADSYADIAARTGLTSKNVSVRLVRLRKKLKEYLAKEDIFV